MFDLTGQAALVTGGSGGIGRAICHVLAAQGASVAVHYHQDEAGARETSGAIAAAGGRAVPLQAELAEVEAATALFTRAEEAIGPVSILVNNAGIIKTSFVAMTSAAAWDEVQEVNLRAAFLLTKAACRAMSRRKAGRIINISSQAGQMGDVMRAAYAASKAGMLGLTRAVAREMAPQGITCNAIAPGFIDTAMVEGDLKRQEAQLRQVPLGRFGQPEEVAALVLFLASHEAAYITGQVLAVDGGLRM